MANITIKDIARMAKVTPAAVSYVINNRPGVSDEKRSRILEIIEETGYNPSLSSRKLVLKKSFNIHIVVSSAFASFDNLFYNEAIMRIMEVCMENGYNLVLSNTENFEESALKRAISRRDVDGVIFLLNVADEAVDCLKQNSIPYVVLDAHTLDSVHNSVFCDYSESVEAATDYVISKGHKKIGFIGMKSISGFFDATCRGYRKSLAKMGNGVFQEVVFGVDDDEQGVYELANTIVSEYRDLTAIICATDVIAANLIKALSFCGICVPSDISVCGVDDILISKYCTPALTTVEINKKKMGEAGILLLLNMIDEKCITKGQNICIHCTNVIERESVKSI